MFDPRDDRRAFRRALPGHVGLGLLFALGVAAAAHASSAPEAPLEGLSCNEQKPLPFLVRGNYALTEGMTPEEQRARAALPRCWIETFERYGFYWLGHDRLEDTMHFEFLGDPDRITPAP